MCDTLEVVHAFAGIVTVERDLHSTGYADMSVERAEYLCKCGDTFPTREEFEDHVSEMDPAIQI